MADKLGPTGEYSRGKPLDATDRGGLNVALSTKDGKLIVDFGTDLSWIAMEPREAMEFATALILRAKAIMRSRRTLSMR